MPRLEPYTDRWIPEVRAFNERISAVAPAYVMGTGAVGDEPRRRAEGQAVFKETLLAVDEEDRVRGGIILQHQDFVVDGETHPVVNIQLPVSEGVADQRFAFLATWILKAALRPHPFVYSVGMGGVDTQATKLYRALGWDARAVPFLFHVHRSARFLRRMPALRRDARRRVAADLAALTGAGWVGMRAVEWWRGRGLPRGAALRAERVRAWGDWADEVWARATPAYSWIGRRDARALTELYPADGERYHCYRLADARGVAGWVVLLRKEMKPSSVFGPQAVGTVLDCLAVPGREPDVARTARGLLDALDVDLSIANLQHAAWVDAFRGAGYLTGPSNYAFATSRRLTAALGASRLGDRALHVTRGDGDGRVHL